MVNVFCLINEIFFFFIYVIIHTVVHTISKYNSLNYIASLKYNPDNLIRLSQIIWLNYTGKVSVSWIYLFTFYFIFYSNQF